MCDQSQADLTGPARLGPPWLSNTVEIAVEPGYLSRRRVLRGAAGAGISVAGLLLGGCSALPFGAPTRVRRIGFLSGGQAASPGSQSSLEAFRAGLRDLGRVDGQDVVVEARYWGDTPEQADALAAELVRLPVEVIVAFGSRDAHAARQATSTIPIVMMAITDPVGQGLVASLARPGGNVTGQSSGTVELTGKRLEMLKELVPGLGGWPSSGSRATRPTCPSGRRCSRLSRDSGWSRSRLP